MSGGYLTRGLMFREYLSGGIGPAGICPTDICPAGICPRTIILNRECAPFVHTPHTSLLIIMWYKSG